MSSAHGVEVPALFLARAWDYLLKSHSHDAINGVTQDKTSEDITYRLNQAIELADTAFDVAAESLLRRLDLNWAKPDDLLLAAYNPLLQPLSSVVDAVVDVSADRHAQSVRLVDADGTVLPIQHLKRESVAIPLAVQGSRAVPFRVDRHHVLFEAAAIPAMGFRSYRVEVDQHYDPAAHFWPDRYEQESLVTGPHRMTNDRIEVQIQPDGSFDVKHLATDTWYRGLNSFEDSGDIGDYWQRVRPDQDRLLTTVGRPADIELIEHGPLSATFECRVVLSVPAESDAQTRCRSAARVDLPLCSRITLRRHSPYVEVHTEVDNTARNHRLRVAFPTGLTDVANSVAQGHFGVDQRPVQCAPDAEGKWQAEMSTHPMQHWVDIADGRKGLAVLNRNLLEYEVAHDDQRTLYLTLLRAVPVKICSEYRCAFTAPDQQGSQSPGKHSYSYAVMPHAGDWQAAHLDQTALRWLCPPRVWQISKPDQADVSVPHALLRLEADAIVCSTIKRAEGSGNDVVVRLFNPTSAVQAGILHVSAGAWQRYAFCKLNESPVGSAHPIREGRIELNIKAGHIETVLLSRRE
jgi:mannosylglycerate hydrolase